MKATVVDLRYKMNDVLKALDRNEKVTVLYHGKVKGIIVPVNRKEQGKIMDHPFFGMLSGENDIATMDIINDLREPRYNDI